MDPRSFDALARSLASRSSRRGFLGTAAALAVGALGVGRSEAGAACPPGQVANKKGECRCPAGTDTCPTGCFDLKRDINNCGRCGATCIGGSCIRGVCQCPAGQTLCNGVCRATGTDLANCGACGVVCPASTNPCQTAVCQNGTCGFVAANEGGACDDGDACTQTDTCRGGVCVGSNPVVCAAIDACHVAGTCDPGTGQCSNPNAPDGTVCNDNNACTSGDSCQSGQCVGGAAVVCSTDNPCLTASCDQSVGCITTPKSAGVSCANSDRCDGDEVCDGSGGCVAGTPVSCAPPNQCQNAGICNASTGECEYTNKQNGTACDTGNLCTSDTCQSGVCVQGLDTVTPTCAAPDACHTAATCNPTTGQCAYPDRPDGTACETGNKCTSDTCRAGVCEQGTDVVTPTCVGSGACQNAQGTCDPATGQCIGLNKANGTACNDNDACTTNDVCTDGICAGTPRANCTPCETFADCPEPTGPLAENTCYVRQCRTELGICGFRYLPDGFPCPDPDPCVIDAQCENAGLRTTFCSVRQTRDVPACVRPCTDVSQCTDFSGTCTKMACVYDAFIGTGGCQVVPDEDANGNACTQECRTCAPDDERQCIPDGSCSNGTCAPGPNTYTCSPAPTIQCCFGQKNGCGRGNGLSCTENGNCCSNNCVDGTCR